MISVRFPFKSLFILSSVGFLLVCFIKIFTDNSYFTFVVLTKRSSIETIDDQNDLIDDQKRLEEIQKDLPSIPIAYFEKNLRNRATKECGKYPELSEIHFNNNYWQTQETSNGTFQLYGAYLDTRKGSKVGSTVRILAMIDRMEPTVQTFCQLWYERETEPFIVKTLQYQYMWFKSSIVSHYSQPYLISCKIPHSKGFPNSVSIVEKRCASANNNLKVIYERPPDGVKKTFAVCVKGLDFLHDDISVRLVEWIELISLLGADKIFFYELHVHPNVSKVLLYYEEKAKIHVTPHMLPGFIPNAPNLQHMFLTKHPRQKRQNEMIPYNDCFYKNMYKYEYIVLLDIDEVIMPKQEEDLSWNDLKGRLFDTNEKIKDYSHYNVQNVYFFDDQHPRHEHESGVPSYMHMLGHVQRAANFTQPGHSIKSFYNPDRVLIAHNHFPLACLGACKSFHIDIKDAQLQHYRADCVKSLEKECADMKKNTVKDATILKLKNELIINTRKALLDLSFIKALVKRKEEND